MRGNPGYGGAGYGGASYGGFGYGGSGYKGTGYGGPGYSGSGYGAEYGTGYGGSSGNSHYIQEEKMLLADQKKQALRYSYETLGNLLSTAENFAGLANEKYSKFNITTSYNYENLKSEFAWELHCFQKARQTFQKKFQCPYQFPNDIPQDTILNDINRYMKRTQNKQDIILFNCMINIIKGDKINIDFEKLFEELDKNANSKIDPNKLKGIIGPLNQILDQQLDEADKGNMNLNLFDDKHINNRENLKYISEKNSQTIKIQIGTEGKLMLKNKEFIFQPIGSRTEKKLKIDEPQFDNISKDLRPYLYSYNKKKGKIYILQKNKNEYFHKCFIFDSIAKNLNKDCFEMIESFEFEDKKYYFGMVKFGNIADNYGLVEEYNENVK